jgi:hypothetical protein
MKKLVFALLAAATAIAITPSASGSSIQLSAVPAALSGTSASSADFITLVASTSGIASAPVTFGDPHPFVATYTESIYTGDVQNPYGASDLTFVYTVKNTSTGSDPIDNISTTNFGAFSVSEAGVTANAASFGTDSGGLISLDFLLGTGVAASKSDTFVLFTNASSTAYHAGTITFEDGSTVNADALVPGAAPEPSSLILLGTGLFGLAFVAFRKSKTSGLVLHS